MSDDYVPMGNNSGKTLKSYVERIERLEEDKRAVAEDIKDIYSEAKAVGFDTKIIRKVVTRRRMEDSKRREMDELLDLYESAIEDLRSMME